MKSWTKLFLLGCLFLTACPSDNNAVDSNPNLETSDSGPTVSVMTYNVENLFDTLKDEGKNDYAFLPKAEKDRSAKLRAGCDTMTTDYYRKECLELDWNKDVLEEKLERLKDTILSSNGVGPDILILQEVENMNVLKMLQAKLDKKVYRTAVLIEGDDSRGIDVAVLSKFPLGGRSKLHRIEFTKNPKDPKWKLPKTRGILEVSLKLPMGGRVVVLGFHFPSQSNPSWQRLDAVNMLNKILNSKGRKEMVIAGGDSNITQYENDTMGLQTELMAKFWGVSHLIGCATCVGTEVYRSEWSFLDVLLFNGNLGDAGHGHIRLRPSTIRVVDNGKYQMSSKGYPARFDYKSSIGVADHLPVYAEMVLRK
jgi:endonuclease/exonuclease/phosphatase family metal-dependent hydrolase